MWNQLVLIDSKDFSTVLTCSNPFQLVLIHSLDRVVEHKGSAGNSEVFSYLTHEKTITSVYGNSGDFVRQFPGTEQHQLTRICERGAGDSESLAC